MVYRNMELRECRRHNCNNNKLVVASRYRVECYLTGGHLAPEPAGIHAWLRLNGPCLQLSWKVPAAMMLGRSLPLDGACS